MNVFDSIMSPLGREHCMIFYYIGLGLFFLALIGILIGIIYLFDKKSRQVGLFSIIQGIVGLFSYYLYRIIYSMCVKSM
jgi:uncharacterized membrane-anchored protein|tara:strand:+ start:73 stop:309 length:237 start_codon:yes stop_codon:yes gene_type:complete